MGRGEPDLVLGEGKGLKPCRKNRNRQPQEIGDGGPSKTHQRSGK
jgi:hypothetical protein